VFQTVHSNYYDDLTQDEYVKRWKVQIQTLCKNWYKKCNILTQFGNNLWKYISSVKLTIIIY